MSYPLQHTQNQSIAANTGTNYTLYYNVLNYFKTIMNNHPSIAQVSQGDISEVDNIAFPSYPLGNVLVTTSTFGTSTTQFNIQLIVADKVKNKNNESIGERNEQIVPFYGVDDMVDIHANTLAILNDLTAYTQRGVAGFEINGEIIYGKCWTCPSVVRSFYCWFRSNCDCWNLYLWFLLWFRFIFIKNFYRTL